MRGLCVGGDMAILFFGDFAVFRKSDSTRKKLFYYFLFFKWGLLGRFRKKGFLGFFTKMDRYWNRNTQNKSSFCYSGNVNVVCWRTNSKCVGYWRQFDDRQVRILESVKTAGSEKNKMTISPPTHNPRTWFWYCKKYCQYFLPYQKSNAWAVCRRRYGHLFCRLFHGKNDHMFAYKTHVLYIPGRYY